MKFFTITSLLLSCASLFASSDLKVDKMTWEGLEVVYIEDNRFPTYDIGFYFADGALSDGKRKGATQTMFDLIDSGTRRFSQRDIADNLEFFGVSASGSVTHEYSFYSISGLVKDVVPTMKKICHLFDDAVYPDSELKKYKKRKTTDLNSMINSHGALASRAFREISLQGSPYAYPVGGKKKDIKRIKRKHLLNKLNYFNDKVKKRIYLTGPRDVLQVKDIVLKECGWKGTGKFVRSTNSRKIKRDRTRIVLVTVPKANQAQVRVGRFLNQGEFEKDELLSLSSEYLGGGFTSKLMRELRVKRGLTYGVGATAGGQKEYGRAVISTSTKNKSAGELLNVTKEVIESLSRGEFGEGELDRAKGSLAGGYPFRFEKTSAYLVQLMFLDHVGKSYDELKVYPERVRSFQNDQVAKNIYDIFGWNRQTIVVLGNKKLAKQLKKLGKVEVVSYKSYL